MKMFELLPKPLGSIFRKLTHFTCNSPSVKTSCRAVYEKFRDGTVKDISDELPFEIPTTWRWVRLGIIARKLTDGTHQTPKYCQSGVPFLSVKDISNGNVSFANCKFISEAEHKLLYSRCDPQNGDILLSKVGTTGIPVLVDTDVQFSLFVSVALLRIFNECVYNKYILNVMLSPFSQMQVEDNTRGVGNKNWVMRDIAHTLIPLPPLAEQKRIVVKTEKLMPLVEEYGKMEEARLQLDADLPSSLEKSILQEAIQGKLVPQDPNDEPASELLKRIATERKALVKAGKLKRDKGESVIFRGSDRLAYETRNGDTVYIQDEIPFEIPDSWEWVRLGDMSNYGQCTSVDTADIAPDTWSLDLEEIEKGTGLLIERKTAAEKKSKSSKHVFTKGTLLYSKLRTYLNKVLVADMDGVCTSEIVPIELNGGVNAEYVRLVLMSPYFLEYTASKGYGIKMPRVSTDDMKQSLIPLPPLDEQKRIVKRVEDLKATKRTLVTV